MTIPNNLQIINYISYTSSNGALNYRGKDLWQKSVLSRQKAKRMTSYRWWVAAMVKLKWRTDTWCKWIKWKLTLSHTRTVVRECCMRATMKAYGEEGNLTPATQKPLNRSSPKFGHEITSGMMHVEQGDQWFPRETQMRSSAVTADGDRVLGYCGREWPRGNKDGFAGQLSRAFLGEISTR